eukprot:49892_1
MNRLRKIIDHSNINSTHISSIHGTETKGSSYHHLLTEIRDKTIGIITLNRPKALNALCIDLLNEIVCALKSFENNNNISVIIITGSGNKAFCAGADIKEMKPKSFINVYQENMFGISDVISCDIRKPIIAAVNGYALGGGCELAMICDIIICSEKAKFGQPEIKIGTIPGMGGTQRLVKAIGKSKAMEMILTGDMFTAQQAYQWGLVSKVVKHNNVLNEAINIAKKIALKSQTSVNIAKECVNKAFELNLKEGILYERRSFHSTFSTKDQKEGMDAFIEKRKPNFTNE